MYRKNTASQFVCFQMLLTATGAVATGLSPTARRCIDGTFGAGGGTVTEDGSTGSYKYAMAQADTNGNDISLIFTATGAVPVCINFVTTAADPTDATAFGITRIDAAISSRMATFTPLTAAQIATGVWQDATGSDFTTASSIGKSLYTSGNAPGAASGIALVGSNMGTITGALTGAQIATAVWTDTTAGDFTVALSIGKSVINGVTLGTGLTVNDITTKTGYSLATAQTFNNTGTWTGNIVGTLSTLTTYTGNTPQTGDSYARVGAPVGASISADIAAVKTDSAAVKVQTDKLTFTVANQIDANVLDWKSATAPAMTGDAFARLGAPAGASVSADVAAVKVDTAAVKVQTDKLTFTVANKVDANVLNLNGDATAAANIAKTTLAIGRCTASGVPTTTSIPTSACVPAGAAADQFKGRIITFDANTTTTALRGQATDITASSNSATPTFTVTALTTAPVSGDTFSIT